MRKGLPLTLVAGLVLILLAAATVLVGAYFFLPSFLERCVARSIQAQLDLESVPEVEFERGSPPEVLAGRFPDGQVTMAGVEFGGVRAERVAVDLDPLDLDVLGSVAGGALRSEEPLSGALRAEVSEEEVSRLAQAETDVPVREVELEDGRVIVGSEASVLGAEVPLSVWGDFILRGGELVFEPWRVAVLGTPLRGGPTERLLAETDFAYPLGRLPYGAEITGVEVAEDRLVLSGEMERISMD